MPDVDRALLVEDGGGRLERHPEVDGLAVGDPTLDAAGPVGPGADAVAGHVELVVVLTPGEVRPGEPRADLEALAGGQAQHAPGEVRLQPIEDRLPPARRTAAHGAAHHAAE